MKQIFVVSISAHVDVTYFVPLRGTTPDAVINKLLSDDPHTVATRLKRKADYAIGAIERYVHAGLDGEILQEMPDHGFYRASELWMPGCLGNMPSSVVLAGNAMASKYFKFLAVSLEDALRQFDLLAPVDLDRAPWRIWGVELDGDVYADGYPDWVSEATADDFVAIGYELVSTLR